MKTKLPAAPPATALARRTAAPPGRWLAARWRPLNRLACNGLMALAGLGVLSGCAVVPKAMDEPGQAQRAQDLLTRMTADQEAITRPIDLYEAMARAIKYNLDHRVEMMEHALRSNELDLKRHDMLPRLVANTSYNGRSNDSGGTSRSLLTGRTSLEPSTSSERGVSAADLSLSWDVLDFGLSYVRAHQAGDETMVAQERKRKVINRIIEDVRTAYWRAVSAERLLAQLASLDSATRQALAAARDQETSGITAPLAALTYQRELLSIRREAQTLERELSVAKQQLAALINLHPGTTYKIAMPPRNLAWQKFTLDSAEMVATAVQYRPELREVAYQLRSNDREHTAVILRALPNLKGFLGIDWNANSFLYNDNWMGWGAQASWNLLNVVRLPLDQQRVKAQGALLDQRSLALTMAVTTQVHVSRARYQFRLRELETAANYLSVQQRILRQTLAGFEADKLSRQTLIREQMNAMVSEVRYDMALADLQNAFANIYASMGLDPFDDSMSSHDKVDALADKLRTLWDTRQDALARTRP